MKQKRLLLAGSHAATTALATIVEIKKQKLDLQLFWIGKKWSGEDKKSKTLEYKTLPKQGVKFLEVDSGKIENKFTRHTVKAFLKIPFGFLKTAYLVLKIKPNLILSYGGAVGFLASFWGWVMQIPVIIHEQTSSAGRANIKSAKFAKKIAISRESSKKYFPENKTIITGDPISKEILSLFKNYSRSQVKTIFVTGGSRGSRWINDAFEPLVSKLITKYKIVWQCGDSHCSQLAIKNSQVKFFGQVTPEKYAQLLEMADVVIGRAGSNTVSELIVAKKPCILIPIPWSYLDEQNENAKYIKELGLARIIKQSELTSEKLLDEMNKLIKDYPEIIKNTKNIISPDIHASEDLVKLVKQYI